MNGNKKRFPFIFCINERIDSMNKFGKAIVKLRVPILIISILLLNQAAIVLLKTRVNEDLH